MGLVVKLSKDVELSDIWSDRKDYEACYKDNLPALLELLEEDILSFIDEAGGLASIVTASYWKEKGA